MMDMYTQSLAMEYPWLLPLIFALFGACIGSFLNVVIYRMPRGMGVSEPRRSFCPHCKAPIPWYLNLPVLSWLMLRGRSACCGQRIALRYWLVELGTAGLFAAIAWEYAAENILTQALLCLWAAVMLACLCIDWEQLLVLPQLTLIAVGAGLLVGLLSPWLVSVGSLEPLDGLLWSAVGALVGYLFFRLVALAGRLLFGHRSERFDAPCAWSLRQVGDDLELRLGERSLLWSELFMEGDNRLTLHAASVEGQGDAPAAAGDICFTVDTMLLPGGQRVALESCDSLSGSCSGYASRREAMGSGDAWLALAIGALCGWQAVLFCLVAGSVLGLVWALIARIGRGQPMPFGPVLILAAGLWLFRGQELLCAYLDWAGL